MSTKRPTALITGTSSGIGLSVSEDLAQKGWRVFAGVRKQSDFDRLNSLHENIHALILDITQQEQVDQAILEVAKEVGEEGLNALVNNAGSAFFGPVECTSMQDVHKQFDLNIFGHIRVTQAALPLLRMGSVPGRIVNIGSTAGHMNFPYGAFYCATKAAMDSISESLRREVAKWGIKVTCVKPGPVLTNFDKTGAQQAGDIKKNFEEGSTGHELYGKDIDNFHKVFEMIGKQAATVDKVTNVIYTALTTANPKNQYYDTYGTYFTASAMTTAPTGLVDLLQSSVFTSN